MSDEVVLTDWSDININYSLVYADYAQYSAYYQPVVYLCCNVDNYIMYMHVY